VAVQTLNALEVDLSQAATVAEVHGRHTSARSVCEAPYAEAMDQQYDSPEEGIHCARGILTIIGLEAAAALGFYGLWQLWHLVR
jgi:hypothetical protein